MSIYIVLLLTIVCISLIVYIATKLKIKKSVESKTSNHPSDNLEKYRNIAHQENKTLIHFIHIGKTGGTAVKHAMGIKGRVFEDERHIIIGQRHSFTLKDVNVGEKCFFIVRDPIEKFISAFYSRKRKGMPRIYNEWNKKEKKAFTTFPTPNDLAKSIYSKDTIQKDNARDAMKSIDHIKSSYWDWFFDREYFLSRKDDIIFVGNQQHLNQDFIKLKNILKLPDDLQLPNDPIKMHKNPDKIDKNLCEDAIKNLKLWYKRDYEFLELVKALS